MIRISLVNVLCVNVFQRMHSADLVCRLQSSYGVRRTMVEGY